MRTVSLVLVLIVFALAPVSLAQKCIEPGACGPYSEDPGDTCMGPDDPFCDGTWGGSGGAATCLVCSEEKQCRQQAEGKIGQETCTVITEGIVPVDCWTSGDFCENITVGP